MTAATPTTLGSRTGPSATKAAEKRSGRVYWWLFLSALIAVPWMQAGLPRPGYFFENPAWSPDGSQIAYTNLRYLCLTEINNSSWPTCYDVLGYASDPAWSPDGSQIAFARRVGDATDIFVVGADGEGLRRVVQRSGDDREPAWSPDGRQIAFAGQGGGRWDLFVVDASGSDLRAVTQSGYSIEGNPSWSSDGAHLAFASNFFGNFDVFVMDADGGTWRRLMANMTDDMRPAWSPSGEWIAYDSGPEGDISVIRPDGTDQHTFVSPGVRDSSPTWSPDGQSIGFVSNRAGYNGLFVMGVGGAGIRQIGLPPLLAYVWATALPAVIHVVLVPGLRSPHRFVRRHTQQGLGLAAMRTISAVCLVGLTRGEAQVAWGLVNGSLWLFGSIWGWRQVRRGECWLMRRLGEASELPRPWAVEPAPAAAPASTAPSPAPIGGVGSDPLTALARGLQLKEESRAAESVPFFLSAFREGPAEIRRRAQAELEALGEVDVF